MAKIFAMDYDIMIETVPYLVMKYSGIPEGEETMASENVEVQLEIDFDWTVTQLNDAKVDAIQTDVFARYGLTVSNTDIFYNKHDKPLL